MKELNDNPNVSEIFIDGNIPFVSSEDTSLVLVDTPGPNNAGENGQAHQAATFGMIENDSKTLVLYILNASQFATNDDNSLLSYVAENMKVGGKQSKDRFIFVINKVDQFDLDEDSVEGILDDARVYLKKFGIIDANIFPASALIALNLRTILKDVDLNGVKNMQDFISKNPNASDNPKITKSITEVLQLNRPENKDFHLETFATLTPSLKNEIETQLVFAQNSGDARTEALIHSGIIPIEAAIKMYVEKYARTAKIKNIVNTFEQRLESTAKYETLKNEIASGKKKADEIQQQIDIINKKLKSGDNARKFKAEVDKIDYKNEIKSVIESIDREFQTKISSKRNEFTGKLSIQKANSVCEELGNFANTLQNELLTKLNSVIDTHVNKNAKALLDEYKKRLADLTKDLKVDDDEKGKKGKSDTFAFISGVLNTGGDALNLVRNLTKNERVEVGRHWVENSNKAWYKPWTWFQESGHYVTDYENRDYVEGKELVQKFLAPFEKTLRQNMNSAQNYADEQAKITKKKFSEKFDELDRALKKKLDELNDFSEKHANNDKAVKESEARLKWLEDITNRVNDILEI